MTAGEDDAVHFKSDDESSEHSKINFSSACRRCPCCRDAGCHCRQARPRMKVSPTCHTRPEQPRQYTSSCPTKLLVNSYSPSKPKTRHPAAGTRSLLEPSSRRMLPDGPQKMRSVPWKRDRAFFELRRGVYQSGDCRNSFSPRP